MTAITLAGIFGLVIFTINQEESCPSETASDAAALATAARRLAA